jgi:hypothetical protein
MQISLDAEILSAAVQTSVQRAVESSLSSFNFTNSINEAAAAAVASADIPHLVTKAIESSVLPQLDEIIYEAVQEAIPQLKLSVKFATKLLAARMVFGMRHGPASYDSREQEIWKECVKAMELPSTEF